MDKLRYRMYDRLSKALVSVFMIEYTNSGQIIVNKQTTLSPDYKLICCTGHRDKNNRPIFEGDLLSYHRDGKTPIGLVEEGTGKFVLISHELNQKSFSVKVNRLKCEVIGNKYQNDEILVANKVKVFL